ncbi:hypothetical protein J3R82DRAFT_11321 [Butyriboletus roseoflavus]|nr:hypothetical protein J3R82DRAFT_11321 [Butyriboletus roseoflavus]
MFHCTTKSDIYSFGNIALQVLSGELPWSECRRDAVIVLHLAKGDKPRRPQSHPINDQHWEFIEHCWSPVQERPSAEHLVLSVLHFSRSYPHSQPLCGLLVSSEKSEPQSTLSRPLLPDIDQLSSVGVLSPPRAPRYPPQLTPDSNSSSLLLPRTSRTHNDPGDNYGNEATSQASRAQSNIESHHQNGQAVNPTDTVFPQRPPPVHSKSNVGFSPFLNTSSIGQDQPNIYPFLYPFSQEHSIYHQHTQETTPFARGGRGATSGSRDWGGGIWSFLSRGFGASIPKPSKSPISGADISPLWEREPIPKVQRVQQPKYKLRVTPRQHSFSNSSIPADFLPRDDLSGVPFSLPSGHPRSHSSRSHGSDDGKWRVLSSNHPSPYPRRLASVRHDSPPNSALTDQQLSMPRSALSKQTVTSERTAGASHRRRKQDANFLCPMPGRGSTFTRSFNLKGHMRSHDKDWPFQCKWPGCGRGFVRQHSCRYHEQFHCKSRPFTCEGCNKIFPRIGALNRHLRTKSGAECKRILDASKVSEGLPAFKTEEKGWPSMSGLTPDHVGPSILPQVTSNADII